MDTDFFLIKKMRLSDESAIEAFVEKYYFDILKYCKHHCSDTKYAEDLTQETFVHFFESLEKYHHFGKAKNYLYIIAGNLCKDYYKKIAEMPMEKLPESDENQTEHIHNRLLMEWALNKLPQELKEVVILYYFQDLKLREIGNLLQIELPLVKYRIKRAKILLEEILGEEDL